MKQRPSDRPLRLTAFDDECERHVILLRFLAFGGIYQDFCGVAWDELPDRSYPYWAERLELSPFVLGRLYERLPDAEPIDRNGEADYMI